MPDAAAPLEDWLEKTETVEDQITDFPLAALAATLERKDPAGVVPPLWHWMYFLPVTPMSDVGADGHAKRGGFLPPVPLPRRMWAGGRLSFHAPLRAGERATRTSTIAHIEDKTGRSGRLVFVTVQHRYAVDGETRIEEEHDIVYRDAPPSGRQVPRAPEAAGSDRGTPGAADAGASEQATEGKPGAATSERAIQGAPGAAAFHSPRATPAPEGEAWSRIIHPDPVLLFRYSALTFNSHRIHYDHPYVTQAESYPGLIVHGPLIATLLVDLLHRTQPDARLRAFAFRAVRPTFAGNAFAVCAKPGQNGEVALWAKDHEGYLTMQATATLA
jgi:3-methylfumaryl-CoA hydratase